VPSSPTAAKDSSVPWYSWLSSPHIRAATASEAVRKSSKPEPGPSHSVSAR
jgi:hypothetical protein